MSEGKQKSGMSTTAKIIIGIVVTGAVAVAICCGGGIWWISQRVTTDPGKIEEMTASIASIDVLPGWEPMMGMNWSMGAELNMAMYTPDPNQDVRMLVLMQVKGEGVDEAQMEQQMQMQMSQQGMNQQITVSSSETRMFVIDGVEREFVFAEGTTATGVSVHQVTGAFSGKDGTAILMMVEDDANWDEAAVEQMIQSISTQ